MRVAKSSAFHRRVEGIEQRLNGVKVQRGDQEEVRKMSLQELAFLAIVDVALEMIMEMFKIRRHEP